MKKYLGLLLASTLVLGACGNKEESKTEDSKKEAKAPEKDKKKEDKKSKEENKKTSEANNTQEQQNTQETVQSQEQPSQEQVQQNSQAPAQQEPINKEQWARENVEGGTDAHATDQMEEFYQQERAKDLAKEEETSDWVKGQDEWMNATESEKIEIRKADAEKYGYEYDPSDYE